ncbi:MAG: hypothetical protein UX86_C0029G0022 [Candidatus Amesbacteria bacterium GW2011_GWC1_47_15]|uniref:Uncharacterized protein n=2 Tax=Candidatus Amesiibacteriota TaxID=1752730 RepID=A0A0G1S1L0_9BACT|nr:MAG: hypothetical protein UX86_C0029G0022 [Candidatus Amesbacteria bacterium GW2011_GWC1_47_15]
MAKETESTADLGKKENRQEYAATVLGILGIAAIPLAAIMIVHASGNPEWRNLAPGLLLVPIAMVYAGWRLRDKAMETASRIETLKQEKSLGQLLFSRPFSDIFQASFALPWVPRACSAGLRRDYLSPD